MARETIPVADGEENIADLTISYQEQESCRVLAPQDGLKASKSACLENPTLLIFRPEDAPSEIHGNR